MNSTKIWRWMVLPATAVAVLTIGTQHGRTQAPTQKVPDIDVPTTAKQASPPPPPSVDALLDQLEQVRKQKAELDAKEKALLGQLAERLKGLQERMSKLGVAAPQVPPPDVKFLDEKYPSLPDTKDPKVPPPPK
jgi:hypothetical protein